MFLGLGKESISIMFAIFSVGVTLFASSPQFTFDDGDDDNRDRKLYFLENFDKKTNDIAEIEKFILYNADVSQDSRKLTQYDINVNSTSSFELFENKTADFCKSANNTKCIRLNLAIIPLYYNANNTLVANNTLNNLIHPINDNADRQNIQILNFTNTTNPKQLSSDDEIMLRYWYANYTINGLNEFPGCKQTIFPKEINATDSPPSYKCTHKELHFIDNYIKDLNYDSYYFDVGNKYQKNSYSFYQDGIKTFFASYMNWLIIGVVLITLVGWTSISKNKENS